jgi:hypothetical protein
MGYYEVFLTTQDEGLLIERKTCESKTRELFREINDFMEYQGEGT